MIWRVLLVVALVPLSACLHAPHAWGPALNPPTSPLQNYDVMWNASDENGLPLNPRWGTQDTNLDDLPPLGPKRDYCFAQPQSCTSQPTTIDEAPAVSGCRFGVAFHIGDSGPFSAHVDWTVATFTGVTALPTVPSGAAVPISDDEDFNFVFIPAERDGSLKPRGMTFYNESISLSPAVQGLSTYRYIELESDSRELRPRFAENGWWSEFGNQSADAVGPQRADESPADEAQRHTDATQHLNQMWNEPNGALFSRAVVTGLFGVDCEHHCRSELHPLYAFAVETNPEPSQNTWTMFVRNWGNGGSCGTLNHEFTPKYLTVTIPPPPGGRADLASITDLNYARPGGSATMPPVIARPSTNDALMITFALAPPQNQEVQELSITVNWGVAGAASAPAGAGARASSRRNVTRPPTRPEDAKTVEEYIASLAAQIPDFEAQVSALTGASGPPARNVAADTISYDIAAYEKRPPDLYSVSPLAGSGQPRGVATWIVLCRARSGALPKLQGNDMTKACQDVPWRQ